MNTSAIDASLRSWEMLGSSGSIAAKVAAVYQLRRYREYGDLLERFCREAQTDVTGDGAQFLIDEPK